LAQSESVVGSAADCERERHGFTGEYHGLAADRDAAYAAWCDLRDMVPDVGEHGF